MYTIVSPKVEEGDNIIYLPNEQNVIDIYPWQIDIVQNLPFFLK